VRIVDAQCHVSTRWYEPVETLLAQMDRNGVAQAVLIQMLGEFDNGYQQACALNHPDRFVSVVAVDPTTADACDRLAALTAEGAVGFAPQPRIDFIGDRGAYAGDVRPGTADGLFD
jgi:L-fuconolactonase